MIKVDLTGRNFEIDDKLRAYVDDKIGALEKYLPRRVRGNLSIAIVLTDDPSGREDNRYCCDAVMMVDGTKLVSCEATVNMFAAIDIVEAKLRAQCAKYKEKATLKPRRMRMLSRLVGRTSETDPDTPEQETI